MLARAGRHVCIATHLLLAALALGPAEGARLGAASRTRLAGARAPAVRMASKAEVTKELVVPVPVEQLYAMLSNFSRYQDIWPGEYQSVQVISSKKAERGRREIQTVEFRHTPVMGFGMQYALDVECVKDKSILWDLNSSNLIASNVGGWRLTDQGDGSTLVTYGCEVELKASVPPMVTGFVLGQAFPKMLRTFRNSAVTIWAAEQAALRARFSRPFEAVSGSLNETVRSLELFAETAATAAQDIARAKVVDFDRVVDEALAGLRRAMLRTRENSASLESPELMSADNLQLLDEAVAGLKGLANATVIEMSSRVGDALRSLENGAEDALALAARLSGDAAVQLADMSTGTYGLTNQTAEARVLAVIAADVPLDAAAKVAKPKVPGTKRAIARGLAAVANGALGVLEAIVPGERPELKPASKRKRLGNLLGFDWKTGGAADAHQSESEGEEAGAGVQAQLVPETVVEVVAPAPEPEPEAAES